MNNRKWILGGVIGGFALAAGAAVVLSILGLLAADRATDDIARLLKLRNTTDSKAALDRLVVELEDTRTQLLRNYAQLVNQLNARSATAGGQGADPTSDPRRLSGDTQLHREAWENLAIGLISEESQAKMLRTAFDRVKDVAMDGQHVVLLNSRMDSIESSSGITKWFGVLGACGVGGMILLILKLQRELTRAVVRLEVVEQRLRGAGAGGSAPSPGEQGE